MTRDDLIMLVKAGYSKDEINTLFGFNPAPQKVTNPAPQKVTNPAPQQVVNPAPQQVVNPAHQQVVNQTRPLQGLDNSKSFDDIYREIVGLRDMVQTNNIINQGTNSPIVEQSAQDALLEILDPEG